MCGLALDPTAPGDTPKLTSKPSTYYTATITHLGSGRAGEPWVTVRPGRTLEGKEKQR